MSKPRLHFIRSAALARDERTACGRRTDNLFCTRIWHLVNCRKCVAQRQVRATRITASPPARSAV